MGFMFYLEKQNLVFQQYEQTPTPLTLQILTRACRRGKVSGDDHTARYEVNYSFLQKAYDCKTTTSYFHRSAAPGLYKFQTAQLQDSRLSCSF